MKVTVKIGLSVLFLVSICSLIIYTSFVSSEDDNLILLEKGMFLDTYTDGVKHILIGHPPEYSETNGTWQEVNTTIVSNCSEALYDYCVEKGFYQVFYKTNPSTSDSIRHVYNFSQILFSTYQAHSLNYRNDLNQLQYISGIQGVTGIPQGDTFVWPDAFGSGFNISYTYGYQTLKKKLIIKDFESLPEPEQYIQDGGNVTLDLDYLFNYPNDVDLYINGEIWDKQNTKTTNGSLVFKYGTDTIFIIPKPYATDSNGDKKNLIYNLKKGGSKIYVIVKTNYTWLKNANYPVTIDPNIITPTDDKFITNDTQVDVSGSPYTIVDAAEDGVLKIVNATHLYLDCDGSKFSGGVGIFINVTDSRNILIENCVAITYNYGIYVKNGTYNRYVNNTFINMTSPAILLDVGSNSSIIKNSTITGTQAAGSHGIRILGGSHNNSIINNTIHRIEQGIRISNSNYTRIENNTINDSSSDNILIEAPTWHVVITNNIIIEADAYGIFIKDVNGNITVSNNVIKNVVGSTGQQILFDTVKNGTIINNTIYSVSTNVNAHNIFISYRNQPSENILIYKNNISYSRGVGVYINQTKNDINISSNYFIGNANATFIENSNFTNITDNIFSDSTYYDLWVGFSSHTTYLINNTMNETFYFQGTLENVTVFNKLKVNVTDVEFTPLDSATVRIYDDKNASVQSATTDSDGLTTDFIVKEYYQNSSHAYYHSDYSINGSKSSYGDNSSIKNITDAITFVLVLRTVPYVTNTTIYHDGLIYTDAVLKGSNITIKVNITDIDGASDINQVKFNLTDDDGVLLLRNQVMTAGKSITNGYTYFYDYFLRINVSTGAWTVNMTAMDNGNLNYSNSSSFTVATVTVTAGSLIQSNAFINTTTYFTRSDSISHTLSQMYNDSQVNHSIPTDAVWINVTNSTNIIHPIEEIQLGEGFIIYNLSSVDTGESQQWTIKFNTTMVIGYERNETVGSTWSKYYNVTNNVTTIEDVFVNATINDSVKTIHLYVWSTGVWVDITNDASYSFTEYDSDGDGDTDYVTFYVPVVDGLEEFRLSGVIGEAITITTVRKITNPPVIPTKIVAWEVNVTFNNSNPTSEDFTYKFRPPSDAEDLLLNGDDVQPLWDVLGRYILINDTISGNSRISYTITYKTDAVTSTLYETIPPIFFVDEDAKITLNVTLTNHANIEVTDVEEYITIVYGKDFNICYNFTECNSSNAIDSEDIVSGTYTIGEDSISANSGINYTINFFIPTATGEESIKYREEINTSIALVQEFIIRATSPMTMQDVRFKTDLVDCSNVFRVENKVTSELYAFYCGSTTVVLGQMASTDIITIRVFSWESGYEPIDTSLIWDWLFFVFPDTGIDIPLLGRIFQVCHYLLGLIVMSVVVILIPKKNKKHIYRIGGKK